MQKYKIGKLMLLVTSGLLISVPMLTMTAAAADSDLIMNSNLVAAATDTALPSDVENLKATSGNGKVTLSWDTATDNVGIKGYKIYYGANSVTNDGEVTQMAQWM